MAPDHFHKLLTGFHSGQLTTDEREELAQVLKDDSRRKELESFFGDSMLDKEAVAAPFTLNMIYQRILIDNAIETAPTVVKNYAHRVHFLKTTWFRYAAAVLLIFGSAAYLWTITKKTEQSLVNNHIPLTTDIPPGKDGAILTLANGKQLVLDSLGEGTIATQNGTQILLSNNQLVYDASATTGKVSNNTITTPKGRQYTITLPDGTKVWLNAASSIEYPVAFNGNERRVKINGELYFEVANNSRQPFIVETDNQKVEVLGTSFNINSYADEKTVQTTLLTGVVKVTPLVSSKHASLQEYKNQYKVLAPGQTSVLNKPDANTASSLIITDTQNLAKITAWKNGLFNFDDVDLYSVMRQLERWYNIEVQYVTKPENVFFKGKIHRNTKLSNVLKMLEMMGVNFELKDNILYVR